MSEQRQILKNSQIMVVVTSLSRVFGLVRDQLIAFLLGATRLGDVWAISFMMPNLFRRLIGEGAMSSAFVPILSELTEGGEKEKAREFSRCIFSMILLMACLIVTAVILTAPVILPWILKIMAPGRSMPSPEVHEQIIGPTQLMFPYLIFISLAAICQGVLNVNNRFALPAATPILLNICIISFGFLLKDQWSSPIWGLCIGVLVGGFCQFFLQWIRLYGMGYRLFPVLHFWNKETYEAIRLWLPTTFSAGVVQINALVSSMIAINLVEGGAIALANSNRLMELILGVFTVALSTTLLPAMSRQRSRKDHQGMSDSLFAGLGVMSLITIPAGLGLMLAGPSLIRILFMRGAFDEYGVILTYGALIFHGMALLPISLYRLVVQTFYAHKQVKVVVVIAAMGALVNIVGCFTLPQFFDQNLRHCGVALATLISSWFLFLTTALTAWKRFSLVWPRQLTWDLLKILAASCAFIPLWLGRPEQMSFLVFVIKVLGSVCIYGILAFVFRVSAFRRIIHRK